MGEAEIKAVVLAALTAGASLWGWSIRRWIVKVDQLLEAIQKDLAELKLRGAVADERQSNLVGGIDMLRESVSSTDKAVGSLTSTVGKLWAVLEAKKLVDTRYSDEAMKGRRG
jgi:hypothetical protein